MLSQISCSALFRKEHFARYDNFLQMRVKDFSYTLFGTADGAGELSFTQAVRASKVRSERAVRAAAAGRLPVTG